MAFTNTDGITISIHCSHGNGNGVVAHAEHIQLRNFLSPGSWSHFVHFKAIEYIDALRMIFYRKLCLYFGL